MSIEKTNDCTTGNLLDFEYFSKYYKLIAIDLSKQIELETPDLRQQINFIGKLKNDKATMLFIIDKPEETTFEFLQNSVGIIWNGNTKNHKNVIDSQTTKGKYNQGDKFETEPIKSSLCDYSDAFIFVTGNITVAAGNNTDVAFKNCVPFSTCKTVINDVLVVRAEYIYIFTL